MLLGKLLVLRNKMLKRITSIRFFIKFSLRAKNSYKVFDFSIARGDENKENLEEWVKVIRYNLQHSQGLVKEIPNRDKAYQYWKVINKNKIFSQSSLNS